MPTASQRLVYAVRTGNYERLAELLKQPDAVATRSNAGRTALHPAAEEGDLEAARMLVKAGADVNARTSNGSTHQIPAATPQRNYETRHRAKQTSLETLPPRTSLAVNRLQFSALTTPVSDAI